jgi:hypothetical protein
MFRFLERWAERKFLFEYYHAASGISLLSYFLVNVRDIFTVFARYYIKIKTYTSKNLPVILYGCEIWSLFLRNEHRLRVSENRVLRRIFGLKRTEVRQSFMISGLLLTKYYSDNRIKKEMSVACSTYGEKERCIHGFGVET